PVEDHAAVDCAETGQLIADQLQVRANQRAAGHRDLDVGRVWSRQVEGEGAVGVDREAQPRTYRADQVQHAPGRGDRAAAGDIAVDRAEPGKVRTGADGQGIGVEHPTEH